MGLWSRIAALVQKTAAVSADPVASELFSDFREWEFPPAGIPSTPLRRASTSRS
jgi:hypothetical protein